jgi:Circularly permutated YpsA SLOG family
MLTALLKVISGGQTGVDRGALDAALSLGVECGGWCPTGRLAEDGTIPDRYPVVELVDGGYSERTARNVADSKGTVIISNGEATGGTLETINRCIEMQKPYLPIDHGRIAIDDAIERTLDFVQMLSSRAGLACSHGVTILNVAGPRASQWPNGQEIARQIVGAVLRRFAGLVDRTTPVNTVRNSPSGDP